MIVTHFSFSFFSRAVIDIAPQRLDSFIELVSSSIEYAESTSYQLKPAKGMPLNVKLLKSILDLTENIRETQAWKASGLRP